jgi:hypothetical protein
VNKVLLETVGYKGRLVQVVKRERLVQRVRLVPRARVVPGV